VAARFDFYHLIFISYFFVFFFSLGTSVRMQDLLHLRKKLLQIVS